MASLEKKLRNFLGEVQYDEYMKIDEFMRNLLLDFTDLMLQDAYDYSEKQFEKALDDAYEDGHEEGFTIGYDEGYDAGVEACENANDQK